MVKRAAFIIFIFLAAATSRAFTPVPVPTTAGSAANLWVEARSYGSMAAAHAAAAANGKGIIVSTSMTISSATTVTVPVTVLKGGGFTKSGSGTLSITGPFEAGLYQIFTGFTAGNITGLKKAYSEWFGPDSTGATDALAALQLGMDSCSYGSFYWGAGTFRLSNYLYPQNVDVIGAGANKTIVNFYGGNADHTLSFALYFRSVNGRTLSGITFNSQAANQSGVQVRGSFNKVEHLEIKGFPDTGLQMGWDGVEGAYYTNANNIYIYNGTTQGTTGLWDTATPSPNSNANTFRNVVVSGRWTTLYQIDGTKNIFYGGNAVPNAQGTGVDAVWNITGTQNEINGTYCELESGSGYPTKLARFGAGSNANKIVDLFLANNNYNMTAIDDLGWANEVSTKPLSYNWPTWERNTGVQNLIANSDFRQWNGVQPYGWKATLGIASRETTTVHSGAYSMKITGAAENIALDYYLYSATASDLSLNQTPIGFLRGKQLTCGAWIKSAYAGVGNVRVNGYGQSIHTGSGNWEWIGASALLATDATSAVFSIRASNSGGLTLTGDIYVSEPMCVTGLSVPKFSPRPLTDGKAELMGALVYAPTITFADGDTTPSVSDGTRFKAANTSGTTITNFDNGYDGQTIFILSTNSSTTIANNATIATAAGADLLPETNRLYQFMLDGTVWREIAVSGMIDLATQVTGTLPAASLPAEFTATTITVTNIDLAAGETTNCIFGKNGSGTTACYSSLTRTVTDEIVNIHIPKTPAVNGESIVLVKYAMRDVVFSSLTSSTGLSIDGVDVQKCGTSNATTCTSMLSSTITPSSTVPLVATMATTTIGKGEYVKLKWTIVTGTGSLSSFLTGTATGVE